MQTYVKRTVELYFSFLIVPLNCSSKFVIVTGLSGRSVIIQVINKIGRPRSGSPICLITSMITDRIGRHEVLLQIDHNFNKICDI